MAATTAAAAAKGTEKDIFKVRVIETDTRIFAFELFMFYFLCLCVCVCDPIGWWWAWGGYWWLMMIVWRLLYAVRVCVGVCCRLLNGWMTAQPRAYFMLLPETTPFFTAPSTHTHRITLISLHCYTRH